ncbi:MAG TPA: nucleotidyltransferase domain-containing protein [Rhodanobacteraceae bacterium]
MAFPDSQTRLAPLIERLTARLPSLVGVYRFGSFNTRDERAASDIDMGLLGTRPFDPVRLFELAGELATLARRDIDLVDMMTCSTVMRAQIVATGELVYCSNAFACEDFATTAYSQYAHLNESRRGILEDIRARGSVYGR